MLGMLRRAVPRARRGEDMKVVCDNCGALYKIPDEKLLKPVNKAPCRQCGHRRES